MISDLQSLLYKAENEYLATAELNIFKSQAFSLEKRLKIYELLRDRESEVFQYVADALVRKFPEDDKSKIDRALQYWISILRYCSMAMLGENHLYLEYRILEWLPEQIEVYELQDISKTIFSLLSKRLPKIMNSEEFSVLQPFWEQTQKMGNG